MQNLSNENELMHVGGMDGFQGRFVLTPRQKGIDNGLFKRKRSNI